MPRTRFAWLLVPLLLGGCAMFAGQPWLDGAGPSATAVPGAPGGGAGATETRGQATAAPSAADVHPSDAAGGPVSYGLRSRIPADRTAVVELTALGFLPQDLAVPPGTRVVFRRRDLGAAPLSLEAVRGLPGWRSGALLPAGRTEVTLRQLGTYRFQVAGDPTAEAVVRVQ